MTPFATEILIYVVVGLLILLDVYLALDDVEDNTISEVVMRLAAHPMIPFVLGLLVAHWLW